MMNFKRQAGITLSELVITVSVAALLLGAASPSYTQFLNKRKVAVAANLIGVFIEDVKMESIKRNEFATVTFQKTEDGTDWCLGAVIGREVECDCLAEVPSCEIDAVPTLLSNESYTEFEDLITAFQAGSISFDPVRGILSDPADSANLKIKHYSEDFEVNVSVNATGSVRKCSPADHKLVGFPTCV